MPGDYMLYKVSLKARARRFASVALTPCLLAWVIFRNATGYATNLRARSVNYDVAAGKWSPAFSTPTSTGGTET